MAGIRERRRVSDIGAILGCEMMGIRYAIGPVIGVMSHCLVATRGARLVSAHPFYRFVVVDSEVFLTNSDSSVTPPALAARAGSRKCFRQPFRGERV